MTIFKTKTQMSSHKYITCNHGNHGNCAGKTLQLLDADFFLLFRPESAKRENFVKKHQSHQT